MFRSTLMTAVAVCTIALPLASSDAEAQVEPFQVSGSGTADYFPLPGDPPARHWAVGTGTHLGQYYSEGMVQVLALTGPLSGEFSSAVPVVFIAADGSQLYFDYQDEVELIPLGPGIFVSVWVAEFLPVYGTGRFDDVIDGSMIMTAVTVPFAFSDTDVPYTWHGEGHIEFNRGWE